MIDKTSFVDLMYRTEVILAQNVAVDGDIISAPWEIVEIKIAENPTEGKWFEYIERWKFEGRI
jgi:hypothetical protein